MSKNVPPYASEMVRRMLANFEVQSSLYREGEALRDMLGEEDYHEAGVCDLLGLMMERIAELQERLTEREKDLAHLRAEASLHEDQAASWRKQMAVLRATSIRQWGEEYEGRRLQERIAERDEELANLEGTRRRDVEELRVVVAEHYKVPRSFGFASLLILLKAVISGLTRHRDINTRLRVEANRNWSRAAKEWRAERQGLAERIAELEAIVAQLPKTADGVPVVPGMELWAWRDDELVPFCACHFYCVTDDWWLNDGMYDYCVQDDCYSTREAAEAAGEETGS